MKTQTKTDTSVMWVLAFLFVGFFAFTLVKGRGQRECSVKGLKLQQVVSYDLPDNRREDGQALVQNLQKFLHTKGLQERRDKLLPAVMYKVSTVPPGARLTLRVTLLDHSRSFSFHPTGSDFEGYSKVEQFICSCLPDITSE